MLTEQERQFLDMLAKAPLPMDPMGLREALKSFAPMMNQNLPEIGAIHDDVELRPGLKADIAVAFPLSYRAPDNSSRSARLVASIDPDP
jgi:hypothetical protein